MKQRLNQHSHDGKARLPRRSKLALRAVQQVIEVKEKQLLQVCRWIGMHFDDPHRPLRESAGRAVATRNLILVECEGLRVAVSLLQKRGGRR